MLLHGWTKPGSHFAMALRKFIVRSSVCDSNCSCFTAICKSPHNPTASLICSLPAAKKVFRNFLQSFDDVCDRRVVYILRQEKGFMCSLKNSWYYIVDRQHDSFHRFPFFCSRAHLISFFVFSLHSYLKYNII